MGGAGEGELNSGKMSVFFLDRENRIRNLNHKLPLNRGNSILGIKCHIGHRDTQQGEIIPGTANLVNWPWLNPTEVPTAVTSLN